MAKSTLLRALQSERGNVDELEGVVASLQQNNSAISEMVESRDSIIDELNNRISVFEEDKVVLKAALRQLQKEIKEEAPKAQKLLDDLADAEAGMCTMIQLVLDASPSAANIPFYRRCRPFEKRDQFIDQHSSGRTEYATTDHFCETTDNFRIRVEPDSHWNIC